MRTQRPLSRPAVEPVKRQVLRYTILAGDISIVVTRKRIRHMHLRVHPPDGRVTISAPFSIRPEVVDAFASTRLQWIRRQQHRVQKQTRETPTRFVAGESHYVWGRRYELSVVERDGRPGVVLDDRTLTLFVHPGSDPVRRAAVMYSWHKSILNETLPPLIRTWEQRLNVRLQGYYLRRMKTRWGTCNCRTKHIRLNTELVTNPSHLLDYVVAHEMVHLIVPNHGPRFIGLMNEHYPFWREARAELNQSQRRRHAAPAVR